jgi:hypothetical protein
MTMTNGARNHNVMDSIDATPYESSILILKDGRVIYHQEIASTKGGENPGLDPVWAIGYQEEWQGDFNDLEEEKVASLRSYDDLWTRDATAANIASYVSYYGHCRQMHLPDWTWANFCSSELGYSDESCYTHDGEEDEDEDDAPLCDNCHEEMDDGGYDIPETENYVKCTVCKNCFDSGVVDKQINEIPKGK